MIKRIFCFMFCAILWAGAGSAEFEYRLLLTDGEMRVLYSQIPSVALSGDVLNLLISPYEYEDKRIAVLVGEDGEVERSFVAVDTPKPLGIGSEAYESLFPDILPAAHKRGHEYFEELDGLTGDLWYYLEKEIKLTKRERLTVVDYVNWEKDREFEAEGDTLTYVQLSGSDRNLFLFFTDEEQ